MGLDPEMSALDPQQNAVYAWERQFADWNRQTLNIRQVRSHVLAACRLYNLEPPPVKLHKGRAWAFSYCDGSLISFPRWCCNPAIAMHETSHYIADRLFPRSQCHGPTWLGIYLGLLAKARVAPSTALEPSARAAGLRWIEIKPEMVSGRVPVPPHVGARDQGSLPL